MTGAKTITLGDLSVTRIGYGAMRLTGEHLWGEYPDKDRAIRLLRGAVELGINLIDTADMYGPHSNEVLIREALYPYAKDLLIATKGGLVRGGRDFSTIAAIGNPEYLRQCVYMSARRLAVDHIDLYYLHSGRAKDASFEDQIGVLAEMRRRGWIRNIGLSNVSVGQLQCAMEIVEITAVTAHHNVVARQWPILDAAMDAQIVFVPWQPVSLSSPGAPTNTLGAAPVEAVLHPIAERHGATIPQIALAWLLGQSSQVLPIPGSTTLAHVRENLGALDIELSAQEREAIDMLVSDEADALRPSSRT